MDISFFNSKETPILFQAESTECGLVSLAMVANYHGHEIDVASLRRKYDSHAMGSRLSDLMRVADELHLHSRAVKLDLDELKNLKTPCILHWDLNHFVVLVKVNKNNFVVHDPSIGKRIVSKEKMSRSFTGVALELTPSLSFEKVSLSNKINIGDIVKWMPNIVHPVVKILMLSFLIELISIGSPLYMQFIIDGVFLNSDKDLLLTIVASSFAILTINIVVMSIRSWSVLVLSVSINLSWFRSVFNHLLSLPVSLFEKRQVGDIVSRFGSASSIQQTLTNYFIESLLDGVMAIGTLILMLLYSPSLTLIVIVSLVFYTVLRLAWYSYLKEKTEEQLIINAKEDSYFIETLRGIQSIKAFKRTHEREVAWGNILVEQTNNSIKLEKISILYKITSALAAGVNQSTILWFGASLVMENAMSIGMYMAFMAYSTQFSSRMSALIDNFISLKMIRLHLDRLSDILLTSPEQKNYDNEFDMAEPFTVEFKNVSFRYSSDTDYIIKDLSFKIEHGEVVAFAGPSGCGKSTIFKLILGFYYPCSGEVLICGVSTKKANGDAIKNIISCVMQDDMLFNGSVCDNISFLDLHPDKSKVIESAKLACIDEKINSLAMGYNTPIGEIGCMFSGGQQQRIILARALYRSPKILLLDEATSSLDSATERKINNVINGLGLTTLVIAHRKETIDAADRVIDIGF